MRKLARLVAVVTLLATAGLLVGCSSTDAWTGTIEVIDGVTQVDNPAEPLWPDDDTPRLSFELEQVFGVDAEPVEAILGRPFSLYPAVDGEGRVYVLDGQANNLIAFEPDGSVRWRVGREGEGPGEFDRPSQLAVSEDGDIVLLNRGRTRVDRWSADGSYLSGFSLLEPPLSLPAREFMFIGGFSGASEVIVFGAIWGGVGSRIAVVDFEAPAVLGRFEWNQLPHLDMPTNVASEISVRPVDDLVAVGSGAGYQFRLYDHDGALTRRVTRAVDYPQRAGYVNADGMQGISSFGEVMAPMPIGADYWLVAVSWTQGIDDPDAVAAERFEAIRARQPAPPLPQASSYDLFDREGRLLYSLVEDEGQWPGTGRPVLIGPDDRLYTIASDPFPQIRRYRVVIQAGER